VKTLQVVEVFYSIQGEGYWTGASRIFVRFAACNLRCSADDPEVGFDCDTEFNGGRPFTTEGLYSEIQEIQRNTGCCRVVLTGGEPLLQVQPDFLRGMVARGLFPYLETNGTIDIDMPEETWVCVSPKTAEHTIRIRKADELRYVRCHGQALPKPSAPATRTCEYPCRFISPACQPDGVYRKEDIDWCVNLVKENPGWRLSMQVHKLLQIR